MLEEDDVSTMGGMVVLCAHNLVLIIKRSPVETNEEEGRRKQKV